MKNLLFLLLFAVLGLVGCYSKTPAPIYTIARDPYWAALELRDKERSLTAFVDALIEEIGRRKKFKVAFVSSSSQELEFGLYKEYYDAVCSTTMPTDTQKSNYDFSLPLFLAGPILVVIPNSPYHSLKELVNRRVGVLRNDFVHYGMTDDGSIDFELYDQVTTMLDALIHGELDAVILNMYSAYSYSSSIYVGKVKVVGPPLNNLGIRLMAVRGEEEALIQNFDEGLEEMKKDGSYKKLLKAWGLWQPPQVLGEEHE